MAKLLEAVKTAPISARSRNRSRRVLPWSEFGPLIDQVKTVMDCSDDQAAKALGLGGGSTTSHWRRSKEVPLWARLAAVGLLNELSIPQPEKPVIQQPSFDLGELIGLFAAVRGLEIADDQRRALTKKLAKFIAEAD